MPRLQLDISDEGLEEIEFLMRETGTPTKREFVNSALALIEWTIRQRQQGYTLSAVNKADGIYRELEMPILDEAGLRAEYRRRDAKAE